MRLSVCVSLFAVATLCFYFPVKGQWSTPLKTHCEAVVANPLNERSVYCSSVWKLYRSYDEGRHWKKTYELPIGCGIRQIFIPSADTNVILLNCSGSTVLRGLYRSCDGGQSFTKVANEYSNGITIGSFHDTLVFCSREPQAIFESYDLGLNWSQVETIPLRTRGMRNICGFYLSPSYLSPFRHLKHAGMLVGCEPSTIFQWQNNSWSEVYKSNRMGADEVPEIYPGKGDTVYAILSRSSSTSSPGLLISPDHGSHWNEVVSPASLWSVALTSHGDCIVGQFSFLSKGFEKSAVMMRHSQSGAWSPVGLLQDKMIWQLYLSKTSNRLYAAGSQGLHIIDLPIEEE